MPSLSLPNLETRKRGIKFLVVGGTAYGVQYLTTALFFRLKLPTDVGFTLGWACSTTTHYLLNRFWALPSNRTDSWRQLREYLLTAALSWAINFGIFHVCLAFGLSRLLSTAVAVPPSTVVVFLLLNYRVFRAKSRVGL